MSKQLVLETSIASEGSVNLGRLAQVIAPVVRRAVSDRDFESLVIRRSVFHYRLFDVFQVQVGALSKGRRSVTVTL